MERDANPSSMHGPTIEFRHASRASYALYPPAHAKITTRWVKPPACSATTIHCTQPLRYSPNSLQTQLKLISSHDMVIQGFHRLPRSNQRTTIARQGYDRKLTGK
jgi:hypothetical protein